MVVHVVLHLVFRKKQVYRFYRLSEKLSDFTIEIVFRCFVHFSVEKVVPFSLPVVLPSKQSTANSFGQMQITSLTPQT